MKAVGVVNLLIADAALVGMTTPADIRGPSAVVLTHTLAAFRHNSQFSAASLSHVTLPPSWTFRCH